MSVNIRRKGGVGESVRRVDGIPKVKGEFEYASDLHRDGMLWGATLRSPHPRAQIVSIDISVAAQAPGVQCALYDRQNDIERERLEYVIENSALHRAHGSVDGSVPGHHDRWQCRVDLLRSLA